jgi:hypothetical protein
VLCLGVAVATCRDDPAGPGRFPASLSVAPVLPPVASQLAAFGIAIDSLRVIVVRPSTDTLADNTVAFPAALDSISLAVSVALEQPAESLDVAIELKGGGFVLFRGSERVLVHAGPPGATPPPEIALAFTGPGANVTSLVVTPLDSVIRLGDSLRFRVDAFAGQTPVTLFYVSWSTSDETLAPVNAHGVVRAPTQRGIVTVTAATPTAVSGSTPVTFIPAPASIVPTLPTPQDVAPGTPLGALRVQVRGSDGLGIKGIAVQFQAVTGGGSVTNATVVTDTDGFAQTDAVAGSPGLNVYRASVGTLQTVFSVNVLSVGATQLAFSVAPAGGLAGLPLPPIVVQLQDASGQPVISATNPVTIGLGANPGGAVLGGTTTLTPVDGSVVFADLSISNPGVGYTLVASATGLTPATSPPFDIIVGFTGRLWTNAAGGNWNEPANWSGGVVPGVSDTAYIALDGTYTVTLDVNATVAMLFVGATTGTQTLAGTSRTLQVDTVLSLGPTALLDFTNGTLAGPNGSILNQGQMRLQTVTVEPDLVNFGALTVRGATSVSGFFTNGSGALTRLEADAFCCTATLDVATFTNLGLLELTAINAGGTTATLNAPTDAVVNGPGATIAVLAGAGGARNLNVELDNQGTLLVEHDALLARASAAHQNSGSIQVTGGNLSVTQSGTTPSFASDGGIVVASGRTMAVAGGAFSYDNPAPGGLAGRGTITFTGATLNLGPDFVNDTLDVSFQNSGINGPGTLTNAAGRTLTAQTTAISAPLVNQGLFVARGTTSLDGPVTAAATGTIQLQADAFCCTSTLNVATGFTNNGLIELTAINAGGTTASLNVASGTLVNAVGGTIAVLAGTGGARGLDAQIDNQGTLLVAQDVTLGKVSADHSNSGSIQVNGGNLSISQSGTSPTFTTTGSIDVAAGRTLTVTGGAFQYASAAGGLGGAGAVLFSAVTLALTPDLVHDSLTLTFFNSTVNGPGTLTNVAGRTLNMQTTAISAPFLNQGLVVVKGTSSLNGPVTAAAGGTIQVLADAFCCTATLTVPAGFTNNGLIELTAINAGGTTATLDVPSGFLVNTAGATIAVRAGAGGARNLQAMLNNQGSILVEADVAWNAMSADHLNGGTIELTGGNVTLTQSGTTPTFTTTGAVVVRAGRTLQVDGGVFNYSAAAPGGLAGTGTVAFSGATLSLTPALHNDSLTLSFVNSTVAGAAVLTNAAGRILTAQTTAIMAPFVNEGVFVARGASSLAGAVTAAAGGTIRVEADAFCCVATLSIATALVNHGLIELTAINAGGTTATLDGLGALTNATDGTIAVTAGTGGARNLNKPLVNQGTVTVGTSASLNAAGADHVNSGTMTAAGGTFTIPLTGATPSFTNQGTLSVAAGASVVANGGAAGTFANAATGALTGAGTFDVSATTFSNDGTVAPGGSPGTLTFNGPFAMGATAVLGVELGGTTAGTQYDQVVVTGTGTLGGTLNVTLINGFTPTIGQVFTVVAGPTVTGLPAALNLPSVSGATWVPSLVAGGLQLALVSASALNTVLWTNGAGGSWSSGTNWSTGSPPGPTDSAVINLPGTYTVTVDASANAAFLDLGTVVGAGTKTLVMASPTLTLASGGIVGADGIFSQSAGSLTGGGTLLVAGTFNWSGGTLSGAGVLQVASTGTLNLSATAAKNLNARTIQNAGNVTWTGAGAVNSGGGAVLRVQSGGTFAVNSDAIWLHSLGGTPPRIIVEAGGSLTRSVALGAANLSVPLDNAGDVVVNSGTLELRGGGTNAGIFTVAGGARLDFPTGVHVLASGAQISGAGPARIVGATVSVDGPAVTVNRLHLLTGVLQGSGTLGVQDSLVWSGGTMQGSGVTSLLAGADLLVNGAVSFRSRTVVNAGTVTWTGGTIASGDGALLQNLAGGLVDLRADASWLYNLGGTPPQLENLAGGVVQRGTGTGVVEVRAALTGAGAVQVLSGTMALNGGGASGAAITVATPATLAVNGGALTLNATASLTGAGGVAIGGGTMLVNGSYDVTGVTSLTSGTLSFGGTDTARTTTLSISDGTLDGSGVLLVRGTGTWLRGGLTGAGALGVANGATLTLTGTLSRSFSQRTIANSGLVVWESAGPIHSGDGAVLRNDAGGVIDFRANASWLYNLGGAQPQIANRPGATLRRTVGTDTLRIAAAVANDGTLEAQNGTLELAGGGVSTGAFTVGGFLRFDGGTHTLGAASSVSGGGIFQVRSGSVAIGGTYDVTGSTSALGGTLAFNAADTARTTNLSIGDGTISGSGVLLLRATGTWLRGGLAGAGALRVGSGATLTLTGNLSRSFSQRTIANSGLVVWELAGPIHSGDGAVLRNEAGGVIDLQANATWLHNLGGVLPQVNNLPGAILRRSAGGQRVALNVAVNNDGTVEVLKDTVALAGGGTSGGAFSAAAGAVLDFAGGAHTLSNTARVNGAGTARFSAGSVTLGGIGANAYDVSGITEILGPALVTFNTADSVRMTALQLRGGTMTGSAHFAIRTGGSALWTGGSLGGAGGTVLRIPVGVTLDMAGTATKGLAARTILVFGTADWSLGNVSAQSGGTLDVQASAVFNVSGPGATWLGSGTPTPVIFIRDRGNMNVTTAGTSTLGAGLVFNNQGTLDIAATATLKVSADLNELGGSTLQGSGTLDVQGNAKVVNQGAVRPGTSPGLLRILGNWPQSTGTLLAIDVVGPPATPGIGFDQLVVSGTVTTGGAQAGSGGTLHLFGNGTFTPVGTYTIMTFAARAGVTFDNIATFNNLPAPRQINYTLTSLQLVW